MNTLEKFDNAHKEAMDFIRKCQTEGEPAMQAITNYLLETDANPYSFLPSGWEGSLSTSTNFESLLNNIHHALFDDGDISFPIVNDEPRISFVWKNEDNYADYVLSAQEKDMMKKYNSEYKIEQCKDVFDFIEKHKEYNTDKVKDYFTQDMARQGAEFAVNHYSSKYAKFNPDWEFDEDVVEKVKKIRKFLGIVKNDGLDFVEDTDTVKKNKKPM